MGPPVLPTPWKEALFKHCYWERPRPSRDKGLAGGSHRDGRQGRAPAQDFARQREPEVAGSDSVGHGPQMEPSWASGAAAGEGRGCPRPPLSPGAA